MTNKTTLDQIMEMQLEIAINTNKETLKMLQDLNSKLLNDQEGESDVDKLIKKGKDLWQAL